MCGIAGILNLGTKAPITEAELRGMLATIRNRGPDQFGIYLDRQIGLASARLSIIDLDGGQQPITNEDGTLWIVFNGEIFNYVELRSELEALGHSFSTATDTEVLLHLYEEYGPRCLERLNGQFAFAIWDSQKEKLFLARDRLGVRPLFYTRCGQQLVFGSAVKALLSLRRVSTEIDPLVLDQVFTFWAPLSPRTVFRDIFEIPPGHFLVAQDGSLQVREYWQLSFPEAKAALPPLARQHSMEAQADELGALLIDATRIRLRADVEVGAYLSGGLDSSILAAVVRNHTPSRLRTFSIAFSDESFDESLYQKQMASFLGTEHHVAYVTHTDIGQVFPEVMWHVESPLMRTASAPMFLLSRLVRDRGMKVVLTGEGADEFLAGYDIFKEAKVRHFWARQPGSTWRPLLLRRLYPDIGGLSESSDSLLTAFFKEGLTDINEPGYSHAIRWRNNRRTRRFFSREVQAVTKASWQAALAAQIHPRFGGWDYLARAQYLEIKIFLSQYLLSSQGDRVAMAHSVEGRFPFLDCRLVEFCNRLSPGLKLRSLTEKFLLRKLGERYLPKEIWRRPKRPYRAPIHRSFFSAPAQDYVAEVLSQPALKGSGLFDPVAVSHLVRKIKDGHRIGETDDMALVGIISTQLLHHQFVTHFNPPPSITDEDCVKVCFGPGAQKHQAKHEVYQECSQN